MKGGSGKPRYRPTKTSSIKVIYSFSRSAKIGVDKYFLPIFEAFAVLVNCSNGHIVNNIQNMKRKEY